ncbi:hypothetical protein FRB94_005160 [Tulasnella sp. JGI-2019a]|nr:hypothetical protein FRB94_005160 [Tulasnella sp. JGI-2019a]
MQGRWKLSSEKCTCADSEYRDWPPSSAVWTVKTSHDCIEELCAVWIENTGAQVSLPAWINSSSLGSVYIQTVPSLGEESVRLVLERF